MYYIRDHKFRHLAEFKKHFDKHHLSPDVIDMLNHIWMLLDLFEDRIKELECQHGTNTDGIKE